MEAVLAASDAITTIALMANATRANGLTTFICADDDTGGRGVEAYLCCHRGTLSTAFRYFVATRPIRYMFL
jgi:hypothetical protein